MEIISVFAAAAAAFVLGAIWYMVFARPWMQAVQMPLDENGRPAGGQGAGLFAISFILQLVVAGMMRHVFALSGIDTMGEGFVAGLGIGLFFISPWIAINNAYGQRPVKLSLIDGGYASVACAAMGAILSLF